MADGLGNAIGGLLGVAILAGVAGKVISDTQKRTRPVKTMKMKPIKRRPKNNLWGI